MRHPADVECDQGFLAGLKIPTPWATGKTLESVHPIRDNYKFKDTVHIPGARCLFLRFDTRCSSQYDYDKVSLYLIFYEVFIYDFLMILKQMPK